MKRYALFTSMDYEARGGWSDLDGTFDTVEEAQEHARGRMLNERYQVVDLRADSEENAVVVDWGQELYQELGYDYNDLISGRASNETGRD